MLDGQPEGLPLPFSSRFSQVIEDHDVSIDLPPNDTLFLATNRVAFLEILEERRYRDPGHPKFLFCDLCESPKDGGTGVGLADPNLSVEIEAAADLWPHAGPHLNLRVLDSTDLRLDPSEPRGEELLKFPLGLLPVVLSSSGTQVFQVSSAPNESLA